MLGVGGTPRQGISDTRRFPVKVPHGATLLDTLNAIVRAHGTLTWAITRSSTQDRRFPTTLLLFAGASGSGVGIGYRYIVRFSVPDGGAQGFAIP